MLFQSGSFTVITSTAFALGLFHPNWSLRKYFWDKFASPLEWTPEIDLFLDQCLFIDEVELSHKFNTKTTMSSDITARATM